MKFSEYPATVEDIDLDVRIVVKSQPVLRAALAERAGAPV